MSEENDSSGEKETGTTSPVHEETSQSPTEPGSEQEEIHPGTPAPETGQAREAGAGYPDGSAPKEPVEDPVEILVGMAERGEIDPWNIDIIEVTDRFLTELERRRQLNLQISGRTLFFAATLLRMKSEYLSESLDDGAPAGGEEAEYGEDFDLALESEFGYGGNFGPIERLEREIQRRLDRKNMRKRPVTLFELIIELKNLEKAQRRRQRMSLAESLTTTDDVVNIAHDEGYQDSSTMVYEECLKCLTREEEMTLVELCTKLGWSIADVYIPLLFLTLEGHCTLRQEEFFGDVYVQICRVGDSSEKALQESG